MTTLKQIWKKRTKNLQFEFRTKEIFFKIMKETNKEWLQQKQLPTNYDAITFKEELLEELK